MSTDILATFVRGLRSIVRTFHSTDHAEVNEFVDYLGAHNVKHGQVWLDIETNPSPGCGWGIAEDLTTGYKNETLGESNCAFVGELISALRARGEVPGTYVSDDSRF